MEVKCAGDLPVYTEKPEHKDGPTCTLHRYLLLPCGFLPTTDSESSTATVPATKSQMPQQTRKRQESLNDSTEGDYELEEIPIYPVPPPVTFNEENALKKSSTSDDIEKNLALMPSPEN